jgi:hypothetical protein
MGSFENLQRKKNCGDLLGFGQQNRIEMIYFIGKRREVFGINRACKSENPPGT